MKYPLALITLALGLASPANAQSWQTNTFDSGALIRAGAAVVGGSLGFACTAPSPLGRSMIETGDHESHRTEAYQIVVEFSDELFNWQPPFRLDTVAIKVGQTTYRLPPLYLDELMGSGVYLSMTDPLISALMDAPSLILDTGQGSAYQYPVDGLSPAIVSVMQVCAARWMELGAPISADMNALLARGVIKPPATAPSAPAPGAEARPGVTRDPDLVPVRRPQPTDVPAITFTPPVRPTGPGQTMDLRAIETANAVCGGVAVFGQGAFWPGDIDGDGGEDIVMNWGFVECAAGAGTLTPVPGACDTSGQCRVTLFASALTARGIGDPSFNAFHAEPERAGVSAGQIFVSTREPFCGPSDVGLGCMAWLRFNGAGYEALNQTALTTGAAEFAADTYAQTGPSQTLPGGYVQAPQMPVPNATPPAIDAHFRGLCQGDYTGDDTSVQSSDIDADGRADFLVNLSGITCQGAVQGRAFCGAANCQIDLFLSSRGYADPFQLLGISADFVQDVQGRTGVLLAGTQSICGGGVCDTPWYWNGTTMAQ